MSEPTYLPKDAPRSQPASPNRKRLLLWVVLVLLFLALYNIFTPAAPPQRAAHYPRDGWSAKTALAPTQHSDTRSWAGWVALIAVGGVAVALLRRNARRARAFNLDNQVGIKFLAEGNAVQAARVFEALIAKSRGAVKATARFNLAYAQCQSGKLDDTLAGYAAADRDAGGTNLRPRIASELAVAQALRGNLDAADEWLAETERRAKALPDARGLTGTLATARSILGLRRGNYGEVRQQLETRWMQLEHDLSGSALRPLRVLRAFAQVQDGGVRDAGTAESLLVALRPARPNEFAMYRAAWPAMDAFLQANGF